jgi:Fe-S cluster assembly protein SufB
MNSDNSAFQNNYPEGFSVPENYVYKPQKGLNEDVVRNISKMKNEPAWMLEFRLKSLESFNSRPMPGWGADLSDIDFQDIYYYIKPTDTIANSWDALPQEIKDTYDKLGIPQAERELLAGVKAQYESEVIYGSLIQKLQDLGVIFLDTDTALQKYPEMFQKYFGTVIPYSDNKFASLNSAVWSGGSFIYIPKGVKVELPLQAYFRINAKNMGQFERTLIIADEGSEFHYIEGCSAPIYSSDSLHSAVVEIICMPNSKVRYTTIQNWSKNVYNLVTKRAFVYENARMEWIDGNIGSKVTMKYPACILLGERAHGEVLSLAIARDAQVLDNGAKMIHAAPNTSSIVNSKSVCLLGGRTSYRGLVRVNKNAQNAKVKVNCDALIFDNKSQTDTYPTMNIDNSSATIAHEATTGKINDSQIYYLMSRGISEQDAHNLIVSGFLEPIKKTLPMEYAVELNRLIDLSMEGSVG